METLLNQSCLKQWWSGWLVGKFHCSSLLMYHGLTHCDLVTPCGDKDRVNIGSDNGLLPYNNKTLPKLVYICSLAFTLLIAISLQVLMNIMPNMCSEIIITFPRGQWVNPLWPCALKTKMFSWKGIYLPVWGVEYDYGKPTKIVYI